VGLPQGVAESREQIREGDGQLGRVPRAHDPAEGAALLDVRGVLPQVGAEERLIAPSPAGVAHHHDADGL
jgi:hypothetical protein